MHVQRPEKVSAGLLCHSLPYSLQSFLNLELGWQPVSSSDLLSLSLRAGYSM